MFYCSTVSAPLFHLDCSTVPPSDDPLFPFRCSIFHHPCSTVPPLAVLLFHSLLYYSTTSPLWDVLLFHNVFFCYTIRYFTVAAPLFHSFAMIAQRFHHQMIHCCPIRSSTVPLPPSLFYCFTIGGSTFPPSLFHCSTLSQSDVLLFNHEMFTSLPPWLFHCSTLCSTVSRSYISLFHHQMFYCSSISVALCHHQMFHCFTIRCSNVLALDITLLHDDCWTFPPSDVPLFHHDCSIFLPSDAHCSTIRCCTFPASDVLLFHHQMFPSSTIRWSTVPPSYVPLFHLPDSSDPLLEVQLFHHLASTVPPLHH